MRKWCEILIRHISTSRSKHFLDFLDLSQEVTNDAKQKANRGDSYCPSGVTAVLRAVALLPVDAVLVDAPIANSRHACLRHGGTSPDHMSPPTVPDEASGTLLDDFHAKRPGHVRFVAVALDGDVLGSVEPLVGAATVHSFGVCSRRALVTTDGKTRGYYGKYEENR